MCSWTSVPWTLSDQEQEPTWIWSTKTRLRSLFTRTLRQRKATKRMGTARRRHEQSPQRSSTPGQDLRRKLWGKHWSVSAVCIFYMSRYAQNSCSILNFVLLYMLWYLFLSSKHLMEEMTEDSTFNTITDHNYRFDMTCKQYLALPHLLLCCCLLTPPCLLLIGFLVSLRFWGVIVDCWL